MAESKGALLAKSVQKHAGRAKEKVPATVYHLMQNVPDLPVDFFPRVGRCWSVDNFQPNLTA